MEENNIWPNMEEHNIWQDPHVIFRQPMMTFDNHARYSISVEVMKCLISRCGRKFEDIARESVRMADIMIKELKNKENESE